MEFNSSNIYQNSKKRTVAFITILSIAVFGPRLMDLDIFLNVDGCERWLDRSIEFYSALFNLDFLAIPHTTHPGVFIMIISGMSMILANAILYAGDSPWVHLSDLIFFAKLPIAALTGAAIIATFFLIRRITDSALFGAFVAIFLAFDPVFLAFSRNLHLDATAASLMLLTLLCALMFSEFHNKRALILSGILCGTALLTRSVSIALIPTVIGYFFLLAFFRSGFTFSRALKSSSLWFGITLLTFFILWPRMWIAPIDTIADLFGGVSQPLTTAHGGGTPGARFNSALIKDLFSRLSPIVAVLATTGIAKIVIDSIKRRFPVENILTGGVFIFGSLMLLGLSFFAKATTIPFGFRYSLVTFLSIDVVAAYGLWTITRFQFQSSSILSVVRVFIVIVIIAWQSMLVIPLHPYYQTFSNPLYPPAYFGWGEGLDQIGSYLKKKSNSNDLVVASPYICILNRYSDSIIVPLSEIDTVHDIDYIVVYDAKIKRGIYPEIIDLYVNNPNEKPEYSVVINGYEYAKLYKRRRDTQ